MNNEIKKWKKSFQKLCNSELIREESDLTGINSCGYWFACDYCDGNFNECPCAEAVIRYFSETGRRIDYKNTTQEYLEKILRGDY